LKAKRPRVTPSLEMKLKIIADVKPGKRAADIGCEDGILSTTVRTTAADKQKYKDIAKLTVPGKANV
jgi:ribosomal protein L11 methylase PrmA